MSYKLLFGLFFLTVNGLHANGGDSKEAFKARLNGLLTPSNAIKKNMTTQEQIDALERQIEKDKNEYRLHGMQMSQFYINQRHFQATRNASSAGSGGSSEGENSSYLIDEGAHKALKNLEEIHTKNQARMGQQLAILQAKREEEIKQELLEKQSNSSKGD